MTTFAPRIIFPSITDRPAQRDDLNLSIRDFAASVVRLQEVDPVLTEMVRLRCARVHDCRLCQSLRTTEAVDRGLDETMADKIDRYETSDLDERTKVALRFTDAAIMSPGQVSPQLRTEVRAHFSDAQIAELAFDIMKWSQQKALVALRIETPPRDGLSALSFDADGHASFGAELTAK